MSETGFLLNLSFPAEARHVEALQDVIVQAVRQAGGDEGRARDFAGRVADVGDVVADLTGAAIAVFALDRVRRWRIARLAPRRHFGGRARDEPASD